MAWHDATCAALKLEWKDGRPGCLTCQRKAPALAPIHPISPPAPPLHTSRSQLICTWPPQLFSDVLEDEDQDALQTGYDNDEEQELRAFICANIDGWTPSQATQRPQIPLQRDQECLEQQELPEPRLREIHPRLPDADSIRLLCLHGSQTDSDPIHCTLLVHGLRDPRRPTFEALSYTWVDFEGDSALRQTIFLGPHYDTFPVTNSCMAALKRYRIAVDRIIWVDAICINQFDLEERGRQVSLMREIYKSASRVLIYAADERAQSVLIPNFADDDYASSVDPRLILRMPYFSRIWVIQEVQLSRTATLTIGDVTISWDDFLAYLNRYRCRQSLQKHWVEYMNIQQSDMSILSLLRATLHCRCGDARDRLYGLLGLTIRNDRDNLPVDYGINIQQLYTGLAMYWLTQWESWPLKSCILDLAFLPKVTPFLPSWVPDWESLSNNKTSHEHTTTSPTTIEFTVADEGRSSAGLHWFGPGAYHWIRPHESLSRWTLSDDWRREGTARPIQEAGIMAVDAVHLLSVSKGEIEITDINDYPLHGLEIAGSRQFGSIQSHPQHRDAQLHILVNWDRACLLRLHANKVYSLDSPCQILCGPRGAPDGNPESIRTKFTHRKNKDGRKLNSMRGVAFADYLLNPGLPERGSILAIYEQLADLEATISEDWLMDLFFFGSRAGTAFAKSKRCVGIQHHWEQRFPLATATCQDSGWLLDAQVARSQGPMELVAVRGQRERVMAFAFENAALGFDTTGSARTELPELIDKIYQRPDSPQVSLSELDAELSSGVRQVRKAWYWNRPFSVQEMRLYLEEVVERHKKVCEDFQPPYLATLQVNPFQLPVNVSTLSTLLQSSTESHHWSETKSKLWYLKRETVRLTVGEIIRNACTLLEDLQIEDEFTLEQNLNLLWIYVLTVEMIARLRGVLQQRLILKALVDRMRKVQKIYLI